MTAIFDIFDFTFPHLFFETHKTNEIAVNKRDYAFAALFPRKHQPDMGDNFSGPPNGSVELLVG